MISSTQGEINTKLYCSGRYNRLQLSRLIRAVRAKPSLRNDPRFRIDYDTCAILEQKTYITAEDASGLVGTAEEAPVLVGTADSVTVTEETNSDYIPSEHEHEHEDNTLCNRVQEETGDGADDLHHAISNEPRKVKSAEKHDLLPEQEKILYEYLSREDAPVHPKRQSNDGLNREWPYYIPRLAESTDRPLACKSCREELWKQEDFRQLTEQYAWAIFTLMDPTIQPWDNLAEISRETVERVEAMGCFSLTS
jgi:hypothetical protein